MSGPRATFLSGASSDMKEPPLRTSCGGGSFVLRSAPERKVALGLALPRRCRYGQYRSKLKMARGLLGRAFVLLRAMWGWWRRAFLRVFCNRRPLHTDVRAKIRARRCFSRIIGGVMGRQRVICRDIRGLWPLSWRPMLLVMLNTPKNARRLEGELREKGNRPVEVCIRRGGLCIYPIKTRP